MITEALLEMHYHRLLVEAFESTFGARFLRLLKPSQRKEAWLGFDQGWIRTELPDKELVQQLKDAIAGDAQPPFYLAYFLQFKVVDVVTRRTRLSPPGFVAPYYRSELSLEPNQSSGMSQHEALLRLSQLPRASVNYACPVLPDVDAIYDPPDPATLHFVDVTTAPSGWVTTDRHFIAFRDASGRDVQWCSNPHPGQVRHVSGFVRDLQEKRAVFSRDELLEFLVSVREASRVPFPRQSELWARSPGPPSLSIVELSPA
jgi:hypothetical protein